ncbi:MAG: hypothetical protein JSR59_01330 [Proteobacteria bacterium]|nr:hypothetical protein [Pseudomonadota bacterium]
MIPHPTVLQSGGPVYNTRAPAASLPARIGLALLTLVVIIPAKISIGKVGAAPGQFIVPLLALTFLFRTVVGQTEFGLAARFGLHVVLVFCYVLGVALLEGGNDLTIALQLVFAIAVLLADLQLVALYRKVYGREYLGKLLRTVFYLGASNAVIAIGTLLSSGFSDALHKVIAISDDATEHLSEGYRATGLFFSGASTLSMFYAFIFLIGVVHYADSERRISQGRSLATAVTLCAILGGLIVSGRTGLVVLMLCLAIYVALYGRLEGAGRYARTNALKIGMWILMFALAAAASLVSNDSFVAIASWAFELYINILSGGGARSNSTDALQQMYFLPGSLHEIFFGTGNFGRAESLPYIESDVGYVLFIFGAGILGMLICFSIFLHVYRLSRVRAAGPKVSFLLKMAVLMVFIGNFKDVYFFSQNGLTQIILLLVSVTCTADRGKADHGR